MSLTNVVSANFAGRVGSAVVGTISMLYFANELGPATLGVYFAILSAVSLASLPVGALSSALAKRMSEGVNQSGILGVGVVVAICISLLFTTGILVMRVYVEQLFNTSSNIVYLLIAFFISKVLFILSRSSLVGERRVGTTGILRLVERSGRTGGQFILVVLVGGAVAFTLGHLISLLVTATFAFFILDTRPSLPSIEDFRKVWSFLRYSWLSSVEGTAFGWMDTFVLNLFVSSTLVGIYEIGWLVSSILVMISASISASLFPEISKLSEEGNLARVEHLLESSLMYAGIFVIPGAFGTILIGSEVLALYGSEYTRAASFLPILVIAHAASAYRSVMLDTIQALDYPRPAFKILLLSTSLNVIFNLLLIPWFGPTGAAMATAVSTATTILPGYLTLNRLLENLCVPWMQIGFQFLAAAVMSVFLVVVTQISPSLTHIETIGTISTSAVVYATTLITLSKRIREKTLTTLPKMRQS